MIITQKKPMEELLAMLEDVTKWKDSHNAERS